MGRQEAGLRTWTAAVAVVVTVIAALATACSDGASGDGASCGRVAPCGGDLVGAWEAETSCVNEAPFVRALTEQLGLACPAGAAPALRPSTIERRISASFAAGGTYTGTSEISGALAVDIPASCLAAGGTCVDLDAAFRGMVDADRGVVSASCGGTTTCSCTITESASSSEAGTYTIAGNVVETTNAGGVVTRSDYCVSGARLHFVNLDPADPSAIGSDAVLLRR